MSPLKNANLRTILRTVGVVLPAVGLMAIASIVISVIFGETYAIPPLLLTAALSFALGGALYFRFRSADAPQLRHALVAAAIAWALAMFLGALPFYLTAHLVPTGIEADNTELSYFRDMTNCFFESVSGFSTTGLTMSPRPIDLPRTLQWWRTLSQWIGGLGIVALMLALVGGPGTQTSVLFFAEREDRTHPSILSTVRTLWWLYVSYTVVGIMALWIAKMPLWDSLNYSMTALATGGFALDPTSVAAYDSLTVEMILVVLMLMGGMNYAVHFQIVRGRGNLLWREPQTRAFLLLAVFWFVALFAENLVALAAVPLGDVARLSFFQSVSAMTTTGFQTTMSLSAWSGTAKLILVAAMFLGASAGSTGGGIKVARGQTIVHGLRWQLRRALVGRSVVVPLQSNRHSASDEEAHEQLQAATQLAFLWIGAIAIGVVALLHTVPQGWTLGDVVFEVTSAQSNVGLSTGITGPTMSTWAKIVLSVSMFTGRLEIIPTLLFFHALLRRFR
ncbi:MAG: TrkH family potassium uptake protein [Candidatus Bipolaricaulis sp.]|nr:TrkH family potassium uptake protein [Candidatus Bipolaricaulis sp.]MDD5646849.1 TrkH family potassium uptake protein [Candidatus Bipolaricaulis sp.]